MNPCWLKCARSASLSRKWRSQAAPWRLVGQRPGTNKLIGDTVYQHVLKSKTIYVTRGDAEAIQMRQDIQQDFRQQNRGRWVVYRAWDSSLQKEDDMEQVILESDERSVRITCGRKLRSSFVEPMCETRERGKFTPHASRFT